jgi:hypothetical protein
MPEAARITLVPPTPQTRFRSRRIKQPLEDDYVQQITNDARYIINITEQPWTVQRTHGCYQVLPCKKGQPYTTLKVTGRLEVTDEGNDLGSEMVNRAIKICEDVCNEINGNIVTDPGSPASFMGVFVSDAPHPSEKRLEEAREQLEEFGHAGVAQADRFWDNPRDHVQISEFHRRFASMLGLKRPWLYEAKSLKPCPACSQPIQAGLAKCPQCSAILDEKKARQYFPQDFVAIDAARAAEAEAKKKPKQPQA